MRYRQVKNFGDGITLYLANCEDIIPNLPRMDALVTDPPYGLGKKLSTFGGGRAKSWQNLLKKMPLWDVRAPHKTINAARDICDEAIIWGGNYFNLPPY